MIQHVANDAAAARQAAREATSKAHAALAGEAQSKRVLAAVLNDDKRLARHRPIITTQLAGSGCGSARSLRNHTQSWVQQIEAAYAGDTWKQMQLATALAERLALKKRSFERPADQKVVPFAQLPFPARRHYVTPGPTAINRRIQHCQTVSGSKPHRSFVDIGTPGVVWMARRSCHQCEGCTAMDHSAYKNAKYQLTKTGAADPGGLVRLAPKKGGVSRAVTRGYLATLGRSIAGDLKPDTEAWVVVDMEAESEAWAICATIPGESEICHVTESDAHEYHNKEPGDEVLTVRKYGPISPGSATFELTDKFFFSPKPWTCVRS